ncbi:MAG: hypothetical protein AAFY42_13600 [Pseudomonadota bacterium]
MANMILYRSLRVASVTAPSSQIDYSAKNLSPYPIPRMGRVWRHNGSSDTATITFDLGKDSAIDVVSLFGIGEGNAPPSSAWRWSIDLASEAQGAFDDAFWSGATEALLAGSALPQSGFGKALWLAPADAPATARYVRVNLSQLGGAYCQIAIAAMGKAFQPSRNYSYGAAFGVRDLGALDYAPRGGISRREGVKLPGVGLSLRALRREEVEEQLQDLLEEVGNTDPVVLIKDPSDHPSDTALANHGSQAARTQGHRSGFALRSRSNRQA